MNRAQYRTRVRRLLHDSGANRWYDTDLNDEINEARARVVLDTGCLRSLESINIATEVVAFPPSIIGVQNISVIWGNLRVPQKFMPFSTFQASARTVVGYLGPPRAWSTYQQSVYFFPAPDQSYVSEWDCTVQAQDLTDDVTEDAIYYPFDWPVPYYAAYLAKFQQQQFREAEAFLQLYKIGYKTSIARAVQMRRG